MTLEEFAQRNGVRFAVLFGSQADGAAGEKSDYDVALLFRDPETHGEKYGDALSAISKHLDVPPERVDIANLGTDNILLRYEVTRGGKLLFGDPGDYLQYQNFAYRDYLDARPLFDLERLLIDRRQDHFRNLLAVR